MGFECWFGFTFMGITPTVNLLPAARFSQSLRYRYVYKTAMFLIGGLLLIEGVVHGGFSYLIHQQEQYNGVIAKAFEERLPQWESVAALQKSRENDIAVLQWSKENRIEQRHFVEWLVELSNSVPEKVTLEAIVQEGDAWTLVGKASDQKRVMEWLQELQKIPFIVSASLQETEQMIGETVQFHLKLHLNLYRIAPLAE